MSFSLPGIWVSVLLLLLGLVGIGAVIYASIARGRRVVFSSHDILPERTTWRVALSWVPAFLLGLSGLLFLFAAFDPQIPDDTVKVRSKGISVALVLDLSSSMSAIDLDLNNERSRIDVAKEMSIKFVKGDDQLAGRANDEISIVTFAAYADTLVPPTLDHAEAVRQLEKIEHLDERHEENATNLAIGLKTAMTWLAGSKAKSKVVVLLTDGVHNFGNESPLVVASDASDRGIIVYAIGVGTNGRAPTPTTVLGRKQYVSKRVQIDEELLTEMASKTGGQYFRATDKAGLAGVYKKIDKLVRSEIDGVQSRPMRHLFPYPLVGAMVLAFCGWLLQESVFRRAR